MRDPIPDEAVEAALAAFNGALNEPKMITCDRCKGNGYHHGFGEDGADPDWCENCGGAGYDILPGEEQRAMRAALLAAREHMVEWRTMPRGGIEPNWQAESIKQYRRFRKLRKAAQGAVAAAALANLLAEFAYPPPGECPECHKYAGKCPRCHRKRPNPAPEQKP